MRVAVLCYRGNMQSGGQGVYLHALTRELADQGHEIDVLVGPPYPDPMPWARVVEIENHEFWGRSFEERPGAFLPRPDPWRILRPLSFAEYALSRFGFFPEPLAFSVRAARALVRHLRAGARYDLAHDVQSLGYGLLWLQALGLPVVATVHHPLSVDLAASLARARSAGEIKGALTFHPVGMQGRVARRLAAIITSSEVSRARIQADYRVPERRIHNLYNGVELPPPGRPRARSARPELLFAGRANDANKGLEVLLAALALLPNDISLRCMCEPPRPGDPIHATLRRLGLETPVRFEGKVPRAQLEAAYRDAAIAVVPSLFEGFGLPAVEALAAGTPVIASDAGALPEVLDRAGAGRRVPARDPHALARAIRSLLDDWEAEQRKVLAARAQIEAVFGWPEVARRTAELYARVLSESSALRKSPRQRGTRWRGPRSEPEASEARVLRARESGPGAGPAR
jgi:glycosyltransferase involved in cell wall biosynthesis